MMVCCFAVVGLITSVISDSFVASQRREQKAFELQRDLKRGMGGESRCLIRESHRGNR